MPKFSDPGAESPMSVLDDAGRYTIAAGRLMERDGAERFREYGLTISDASPLARLVQLGPMTPTELLSASILLTSAPVVSHSINRLERAGFVVRRPHESDGRKTLIEATDEGRKVFFDLYREIQEIQEGFFAPLDEDEIRQVRDLLLRCLSERMS